MVPFYLRLSLFPRDINEQLREMNKAKAMELHYNQAAFRKICTAEYLLLSSQAISVQYQPDQMEICLHMSWEFPLSINSIGLAS